VIAEDSVLLRAGLTRLLDDARAALTLCAPRDAQTPADVIAVALRLLQQTSRGAGSSCSLPRLPCGAGGEHAYLRTYGEQPPVTQQERR
jgi:hypothetical protein